MALLEQLRPNLLELPYEEALHLFTEYYHKRERDLTLIQITPTTTARKAKASNSTAPKAKKEKTVTVSSDQLALLKKLGLI
jgi:hypothetical protein